MTGEDVMRMRGQMAMTQQAFATLLGVSFVTVNRWENGHAQPTGLGLVLLQLLQGALAVHKPLVVQRRLRAALREPVETVRELVRLEKR